MKIRTIITATCAALAFSMAGPVSAQDGKAEAVTKDFEAAIPNIRGKSLLAVEVDYAPGAASPSHTHAKTAFIYAYVISGAIESEGESDTRPSNFHALAGAVPRSAATLFRPNAQWGEGRHHA